MVPAVVVAATLVCGATPGPAATADGSTPAARCAVSRELMPSCGVLLGAATHKVGTQTWDQSVATHEKLIGRKVDVLHNYHQWDTRQRADGLTLTILDAAAGRPSALGSIGGGLGWSGIPGFAVAFDTFQDPGDPSYNSVGLVTGWNPAKADRLVCSSAATAVPLLRDNLRHIAVRADQGVLTVTVDG